MTLRGVVVVVMAATLLASCLSGESASAAPSVDKPCADIETVFARGSGQSLSSEESNKYQESLQKYVTGAGVVDINFYELGTEHQSGSDGIGYKYPAVAVTGSIAGGWRAVRAKMNGGMAGEYGKSVGDGAKELALYLTQRFTRPGDCQQSRIIISGYSQGAQVIGQLFSLNPHWIDKSVRERIDYIALLGDPKLYLPEGNPPGVLGKPAGCLAPDNPKFYNSPWRIDVADCAARSGSLGARAPYTSSEFVSRYGLWCHDPDVICNDRNGWAVKEHRDGHGRYVTSGHVEAAVIRSLQAVAGQMESVKKVRLLHSTRNNGQPVTSPPSEEYFTESKYKLELYDYEGAYGLPCKAVVVTDRYQPYVIDSVTQPNGSAKMVKFRSKALIEHFLSAGCEVRVMQYDSIKGEVTLKNILNHTKNVAEIEKVLNDIKIAPVAKQEYLLRCAQGSHDRVELQLLKDHIRKYGQHPTAPFLVAVTDADICGDDYEATTEMDEIFDTQDKYGNLMTTSISPSLLTIYAKSSKNDINLYIEGFENMLPTKPQPQSMTQRRLAPTQTVPSANFSLRFEVATIYGEPNQDTNFVIRPVNPAVSVDEYLMFLWDFNGDGNIDAVTEDPYVKYRYKSQYEGKVIVRGLPLEGGEVRAEGQAVIEPDILSQLDSVRRPAAPANLALERVNSATVIIRWQAADKLASSWMVQLNDSPGQRVEIDGELNVEITDVDTSKPLSIHVRGLTKDGYMGEVATVGLRSDGAVTNDDEYAKNLRRSPTPGGAIDDSLDASQNAVIQPDGIPQQTQDSATGSSQQVAMSQWKQHGEVALNEQITSIMWFVGGGIALVGLLAAGGVVYYRRTYKKNHSDSVFLNKD